MSLYRIRPTDDGHHEVVHNGEVVFRTTIPIEAADYVRERVLPVIDNRVPGGTS